MQTPTQVLAVAGRGRCVGLNPVGGLHPESQTYGGKDEQQSAAL